MEWSGDTKQLVRAWLAFKELSLQKRAVMSTESRVLEKAQDSGFRDKRWWFLTEGSFREHVLASPYKFRIAYEFAGSDVWFGDVDHSDKAHDEWHLVRPENLPELLAKLRGVAEDSLFSAQQVSVAMAQYEREEQAMSQKPLPKEPATRPGPHLLSPAVREKFVEAVAESQCMPSLFLAIFVFIAISMAALVTRDGWPLIIGAVVGFVLFAVRALRIKGRVENLDDQMLQVLYGEVQQRRSSQRIVLAVLAGAVIIAVAIFLFR